MTEYIHIKPGDEARGCDVHEWPSEGLARRLVAEMRRMHGRGGVNACPACIHRAKADAARAVGRCD